MAFFNFGESILNWVKLFNSNIKATVLQCGTTSEFFSIERGCRQGDPIATYLFLLVAQVLTLMINQNENVKGIEIDQTEYLLSQFADDTTLLLDGSLHSLQAALNTLEVFGTMSGLKMNKEKTKVIWLGRKRFSKEKLQVALDLNWGESEFDLLGLRYNVNLSKMVEVNYTKVLNNIQSTLKSWNKRYLTPIGKITVLKTLVISKYIHLFMSLPTPGSDLLNTITSIMYSFIWSGKPDKIKRSQLIQTNKNGGLNMMDLNQFIKSLKLTWIRRLIKSDGQPWAKLVKLNANSLIKLGPLYTDRLISNMNNPFWKDTLKAWSEISKLHAPTSSCDFLTSPIWCNDRASKHPFIIQQWYDKHIENVGDILGNNAVIMTHEDIIAKYGVNRINFLDFLRLRNLTQKFVNLCNIPNQSMPSIQNPVLPFNYSILSKCKKGAKEMNKIFSIATTKTYGKNILELDLHRIIDDETWQSIFEVCFKTVNDNYLIWHQYKILNRILGVREYLNKVKIINNPQCTLCNAHTQTLLHLFCKCEPIIELWNNVQMWINTRLGLNVPLDDLTIVMGYLIRDEIQKPLNTLILSVKAYIFWCSRFNRIPNIYTLQIRAKRNFDDQFAISKIHQKEEQFIRIWHQWVTLFDNI